MDVEDREFVVDHLTPKYKALLENILSAKERALLVNIIKIITDGRLNRTEFTFSEIKGKVGISQNNYLASLMTRLKKKGIIRQIDRGEYEICDIDLIHHINVRCLNRKVGKRS